MIDLSGETDSVNAWFMGLRKFRDPLANCDSLSVYRRPAWPLIAGLLLITLLPRAMMAWKLDVVCPDAVYYIQAASAISENGTGGARGVPVSLLSIILVVMHRIGIDYETAGKLWGVSIATLAVLPLLGWLRRQFNEPLAVLACGIYAFHPKLIEWSPEIIRGPTFWFLFLMSLYLGFRAVTQRRVWLFTAAGISVSLATVTRIEGVFLLVPYLLWVIHSYRAAAHCRRRLVISAAVGLGILPTLWLVANATVFRGHANWHWQVLVPLTYVSQWFSAVAERTAATATGTGLGWQSLSAARRGWMVIDAVERGMTPLFSVCWLVGMWRWRRLWLRRDVQPLVYLGVAVFFGMWFHLWRVGETSTRYVMPIVLMGTSFAGLGLIEIAEVATRTLNAFVRRLGRPLWSPVHVFLLATISIPLVGMSDALSSSYQSRQARAEVGRHITKTAGPEATIAGPLDMANLVTYYAGGSYIPFVRNDRDTVYHMVIDYHPDVVLLSCDMINSTERGGLVLDLADAGWKEVADRPPSQASGGIVLLMRDDSSTDDDGPSRPRVARTPRDTPPSN